MTAMDTRQRNLGRRAMIGVLVTSVVVPFRSARSDDKHAAQLKIGPEHFILNLADTTGSVLVDLISFRQDIQTVPAGERQAFAIGLGRKVAKLVLDELEGADAQKLSQLTIDFVYVTQRDEYQKPRPGGLQRIGGVQARLEKGVVGSVSTLGEFSF